MKSMDLNKTVFFEKHLCLKANMVEFSGWQMPLHYETGIVNEHLLTRKKAGIFDVCHMGRFVIKGKGALDFLMHVLTNNAGALRQLESQYTIIPDNDGYAIDDAYLYRFFKDEYILVVNAGNRAKDYEHLKTIAEHAGNVKIVDATCKLAMIGLQGPESKNILLKVINKEYLPDPIRNNLSIIKINDAEVLLARTGYTGEPLCFELFIKMKDATGVWDILVKNGAIPAGLGARDTLRLEASLPLYGHEIGQDIEGNNIPIFASPLSQLAVSFSPNKKDFIGRNALLGQFKSLKNIINGNFSDTGDLPRRIMPFVIKGRGVARRGDTIYFNNKKAGYVTSGTAVPYLEAEGTGLDTVFTQGQQFRSIGLALVNSSILEEDKVDINVRGKMLNAVITPYHIRSEAPPFAYPIIHEEKIIRQGNKTNTNIKPVSNFNILERAALFIRNTQENTLWRQTECINLIPSEQTASKMVRLLSIMDPAGRYAEHKKIKAFYDNEVFYYQGTDFIAETELLLKNELSSYLGCTEVEVRPVSGQMANSIVFSALVEYFNRAYKKSEPERLGYVLNHHIIKGGHLSAQPMGALRDFVFIDPLTDRPAVIDFPVNKDNPYIIDIDACGKIIEQYRPSLIIFGKSAMLHKEPVSQIKSIVKKLSLDTLIMYDAAHVMGLLGPYFQKPFNEGADILTGSTHKTFFGTQRGVIASNYFWPQAEYELWETIERRTFPGSLSNHHPGTLVGLLMAAYEMNHFKNEYQQKVLANAKIFASALSHMGVDVAGDPALSFTETHQVIINVGYSKGYEIAKNLEQNNIIVNYQASPSDEGFTAAGSIRMGVGEMTRFGMEENDFEELAQLIYEVVIKNNQVKDKVKEFRQKFLEMRYCFSDKETGHIMDKIIKLL